MEPRAFSRKFGQQFILPFWIVALVFTSSHPVAFANPSGAQVVYGSAALSEQGSVLEVRQSGQKLIIDWQGFSIDSGETTRFIQPSSDAAVLNRVVSSDLSQIHGSLYADGRVYLINPNGILFGENARVDTASFTASTLGLDNAEFLKGGSLTFKAGHGDLGQIVNAGSLRSLTGDLTLISEVIRNQGDISAPNGSVNLAAGREVVVQPDAEKRIFITLPSDHAHLENSGAIEAARAEIIASHSNPYSLAINQSGVVHATGTEEIDGEIWLVANAGTVEISGAMSAQQSLNRGFGGEILATGSRIALQDGAELLAEGNEADGGRIRIGGSRRGQDESIFHSDRTYIDAGARVSVNATGTGNQAGTLIAWGNETLRAYGELLARGDNGADGGFIETSAAWFDLGDTTPDVGSTLGNGGSWLIDPSDIRITDGAGDDFDDTDAPFDNPNQDIADLDVDTVLAALSSGTGVTVIVETGGTGTRDGDIDIQTDIDFNGIGNGDTLWLKAHREIVLETGIAISDTVGSDDSLNVVFQADKDGDGDGRIVLDSGSNITTGGGEIILSGGNYSTLDDLRDTGFASTPSEFISLNVDGATLDTGSGNITIRGAGGVLAGVRLRNAFDISTTTGNIDIYGVASTTDTSAVGIFVDGAGTLTSNGGTVSLTGIGNSDNSGTTAAHGIRMENNPVFTLSGTSELNLDGTGSQELSDSANNGIRLQDTTLSVENGAMNLMGTGGYGTNSRGLFQQESFLISTGSGDININATSQGDEGILVSGGGSSSGIGGVGASGNFTLTAGTVSGTDAIEFTGTVTIQTSGSVTLQPADAATTVGVGTGSTGLFYLEDGELTDIVDGVSGIIIGRTDGTAAMDVRDQSWNDPLTLQSQTGTITINATQTMAANDISIRSDSIDFAVANSVTGTGSIYIEPGQTSTSIGLGDSATGTLNLDSTQLGRLADGFESIVFGRTDGTGAIDIEALTFTDDVLLRSLSGDIDIDGALNVGANDLGIETGGSVTQSAAITATGLALLGAGTKTLENSSNDVVDIATDGAGSVSFVNLDDFNVDGVTVNGTTTSGLNSDGDIILSVLSGDLTINTDSDTNGTNGATWWFQAEDDIIVGGGNISDSVGSDDILDIIFQSDSDGSDAGGVEFNGSNIVSNGGDIVISGGNHATIELLKTTGLTKGTIDTSQSGFFMNGASIDSGAGDVVIRAEGNIDHGIEIRSGASITSTSGDITLFGEGTAINDKGILIDGSSSITSAGGAVSLTGIGQSGASDTDRFAHGIHVMGGSDISLNGASTLLLDGTASQQALADQNYGVFIEGVGTVVSVENGNMTIVGVGGADVGGYGFYLNDQAVVQSTGSGDISITATSEDSIAFYTDSTSAFTLGGASMTGDIYLIANDTTAADSVLLDTDLTIQTAGTVYLQPGSASETIGIGNSATGDFNLDAGELGTITDGTAGIVVGRTDGTAAIDVEALTFTDDVMLRSLTGNVDIDGALNFGTN
ncbi:MAG: filamentous hemagglutinin N-terminal domain-containing protein, partial [Opitutales bacterium]